MKLKREIQYRMLLDRYAVLRSIRDGIVCLRWGARVAGAPFPPTVKRALLLNLAETHHLGVLVETGTYLGDTSAQLSRHFQKVHTIEAARELYEAVEPRFESLPNVARHFGDSGAVLANIVPVLDGPALFWLDAHVQGFRQEGETNPILREVATISADTRHKHVIAIDDMRLFGKAEGYPTMEALRSTLSNRHHQFTTVADIGLVCFES